MSELSSLCLGQPVRGLHQLPTAIWTSLLTQDRRNACSPDQLQSQQAKQGCQQGVGLLTVHEGHLGAVPLLKEAVQGDEHHLHGQIMWLHPSPTVRVGSALVKGAQHTRRREAAQDSISSLACHYQNISCISRHTSRLSCIRSLQT